MTVIDNGSPLNDWPNAGTPNATNTPNLNNQGIAEDQPIQLPVGSHSIVATYNPRQSKSTKLPDEHEQHAERDGGESVDGHGCGEQHRDDHFRGDGNADGAGEYAKQWSRTDGKCDVQ